MPPAQMPPRGIYSDVTLPYQSALFNASGLHYKAVSSRHTDALVSGFIQCCYVTNSVVPSSPFQVFFVDATNLVLQQTLLTFLLQCSTYAAL